VTISGPQKDKVSDSFDLFCVSVIRELRDLANMVLKIDYDIGAGSGGRGHFGPPWTTFAPPQTFILGHIWDKKRSGEDFILLILGQKHSKTGEDLFF